MVGVVGLACFAIVVALVLDWFACLLAVFGGCFVLVVCFVLPCF